MSTVIRRWEWKG